VVEKVLMNPSQKLLFRKKEYKAITIRTKSGINAIR
jgi:hypothetical protein